MGGPRADRASVVAGYVCCGLEGVESLKSPTEGLLGLPVLLRLVDVELAESCVELYSADELDAHSGVETGVCSVGAVAMSNAVQAPALSTERQMWLGGEVRVTDHDVDSAASDGNAAAAANAGAAGGVVVDDVDNDAVEVGTGVETAAGAAAEDTALPRTVDDYKAAWLWVKVATGCDKPAAVHTERDIHVAAALEAVAVVVALTVHTTFVASGLC